MNQEKQASWSALDESAAEGKINHTANHDTMARPKVTERGRSRHRASLSMTVVKRIDLMVGCRWLAVYSTGRSL